MNNILDFITIVLVVAIQICGVVGVFRILRADTARQRKETAIPVLQELAFLCLAVYVNVVIVPMFI